jgi:molybdopterin synthase catalytic subunit
VPDAEIRTSGHEPEQEQGHEPDHDAGAPAGHHTMGVLLFAGLAELAGCARLEFGAPWPATVSQLRDRLATESAALGRATFRIAVNQRYASEDETLKPGDEIALIPPVSGG